MVEITAASLQDFFRVFGAILALFAFYFVIRAIPRFAEREEGRGAWLILVYAVTMFAMIQIVATLSFVFRYPPWSEYVTYLSILMQVGFLLMIVYTVFGELKAGKGLGILDLPTLEPRQERANSGPRRHALEPGISYLIASKRDADMHEVFVDAVTHEHEGLQFTRTIPATLRSRYHLETTNILWLTREEAEGVVRPNELEKLDLLIRNFLRDAKRPIIAIDGITYIASYVGFAKFLKLLHSIKDAVAVSGGNLLIHIEVDSIEKMELAALRLELRDY